MRVRRSVSACVCACTWVVLLSAVLAPAPFGAARAASVVPSAVVGRGPDPSVPAVARWWPVGTRPAVLRGWEPPADAYGPGHRGVDLAAAGGTPVRAVAAGRVSFAGRVAVRGVVSLELTGTGDPPLRTTYEPVAASVREGDEVAAGEVLGTAEPTGSHCTACLHWGLLRGDVYLDPLSLLPPWLLDSGPSILLPVLGVPLPGEPSEGQPGVRSADQSGDRSGEQWAISRARPAAPWRPPPG
ncbi:murein hydrolase activator EnvC family protein [Streptomyces sp. NPDC015237]|uniref:murein hydrolase activator EnvC family protein n=1 Tax=Streptomyces sp. NPDC015237 TaxID=3364949 RepID=UPI0036FFA27D